MNYQEILQETLGSPFRDLLHGDLGGQIREASGPCWDVLTGILRNVSGCGRKALRDTLKRDPSGCAAGGTGTCVNTFPFGQKTDKIYHDYIGITIGGNPNLQKVLENAERHCWDMERGLDHSEEKTVLIITDKWDQMRFQQEFEEIFLRYAIKDRVLFMFILVTDYGASQIPFLPVYRSELDRFTSKYIGMGGLENQFPLDFLLGSRTCTYNASSHGHGGYIDTSYQFDFADRTYKQEQASEQLDSQQKQTVRSQRSDEIDIAALVKFAAAVYELHDLPRDEYIEHPEFTDGENGWTQYSLSIFGKTFKWGPGLGEFEKIKDAVEELVRFLA